mgnify:CR=1 FL=1
MQKTAFKEIKIELPDDLIEAVSKKEIIEMLLDKALSKAEYYRCRCKEFEGKYCFYFISFKKKVEQAEEEVAPAIPEEEPKAEYASPKSGLIVAIAVIIIVLIIGYALIKGKRK